VSAYAQLSAQITGHVEHAIFNEERTTMHAAVQVHEEKKAESDKLYVNATKEIAMQKQTIAHLNDKITDLEAANAILSRSHQTAKRELELAARNQNQTSQFCVELRMQGLDFKAEVERRTAKMLDSIQSRLGFVPACVQKQALQLRVLKVGCCAYVMHALYDRLVLPFHSPLAILTTTKCVQALISIQSPNGNLLKRVLHRCQAREDLHHRLRIQALRTSLTQALLRFGTTSRLKRVPATST
jgi:hypothetical protein